MNLVIPPVPVKLEFNGIHIDLRDISMISHLEKKQGQWIASVVWRNTGMAINLKMASVKDQFTLVKGDEQVAEEEEARANYKRLVEAWTAAS